MSCITLFIILILTLVKNSFAVRCDSSNPCQLYGVFMPPNYNCFQLANNVDVVCTCPDGTARQNAPCRICDNINCGSNGVCLEVAFGTSFYLCGCTNSTFNYVYPGPCPDSNSTIIITSTTTITTITTTTTVTSTRPPLNCLNGGVYNGATNTCICRTAFTGSLCETSLGQELCRHTTCANGGICNPVPTANDGFEIQCWCLDGFSGSNCELIGTKSRCASNFCQNGGICEERRLGTSLYAYCQCSPGFTGRCCEIHYFTCFSSGLFADSVNCKFGRYFECIGTIPIIRSCPKASRFNSMTMTCDSNGSCPS